MLRYYQPGLSVMLKVLLVLIAEILCGYLSLAFYLWVESSYCAPQYIASGHCYAPWFNRFEAVFFGLVLCLLSITALGLVAVLAGHYRRQLLQWGLYFNLSLLALLVWFSEGLFLWQVVFTMGVVKMTQLLLLRCYFR